VKNKLFTMPDCPHCQTARAFLDRRSTVYLEYDLSSHPDALRALLTLTGRSEVPTLVAGYEAVVGFDVEQWTLTLEHAEAIEREDPFRLPESLGPDPYDGL